MREELSARIDNEGLNSFCSKNHVLSLYIFGSQLSGDNDRFSDLDLAVLFYPCLENKINEIDFYIQFSNEIRNYFDFKEIDLVFLQKTGIKLSYRVVTEGCVIYCTDQQKRLDYEDIIICKGLDFKGELALYYKELEDKVLAEGVDFNGR